MIQRRKYNKKNYIVKAKETSPYVAKREMSLAISCVDSERLTVLSYGAPNRYNADNSRVWINQVNNPRLDSEMLESSEAFDSPKFQNQ